MRVLHLPTGRQMTVLCPALRKLGVKAVSCSFSLGAYKFHPDQCLNINKLKKYKREEKLRKYFFKVINSYDVFHFHFGKTFFPEMSELAYLKEIGKKLIMQHRGSDVRRLSLARKHGNRFVRVKSNRTEKGIKKKLQILSKYIDHVVIADHELVPYVKPYYKHIHIIPQAINLETFRYTPPRLDKEVPLIVHAPTNPYLKGTDFVEKAINKLKKKGYKFKFKLIEKLPHKDAVKLYKKSDIIIDQLLIGSLGVLSLEAMALGKPVICYVREDLVGRYPASLPVVNANPDTVYKELKKLLDNPSLRFQLGEKGRAYVSKYHDSKKIAKQLCSLYEGL